jgi:hypothetical protein
MAIGAVSGSSSLQFSSLLGARASGTGAAGGVDVQQLRPNAPPEAPEGTSAAETPGAGAGPGRILDISV